MKVEDPTVEKAPVPGTTCHLCHAIFANVDDQRQHTRSDFHRYNLKLQVKGFPTVNESDFNDLIGDLDESISGSDSSDSESEDDGHGAETTLKALLKRQVKIEDGPRDEPKPANASVSPFVWFTSSAIPPNTSLGMYKVLLGHTERSLDLVEVMKRKQVASIQSQPKTKVDSSTESPSYFLCMTGGGHFAAMIVSLVSSIRKGARGFDERHATIKAHKTFHRYTTRRKQGGSQAANDNAKGAAHSAGASIRRYNEMALEADIRRLLSDWKQMIDQAELLFVRATGIPSRRTLYGPYEGQVIRGNDDRIRSFPFNTRRATQSELLRSFNELTRFKVSNLEAAPTPSPAVKPEKEKKPVVKAVALSEEEEALQMHGAQIQALIKRTKAPALLTYLKNNDLSPDMTFVSSTYSHHTPTPLHFAASTNSSAVVLALLTQARANPSNQNADGHTPYELAGDIKTRNAFRIARHSLGDLGADWNAAHVPSGLSAEEAEARLVEGESAERELELKRRQADLETIRQQEEAQRVKVVEKKAGKGKSLGLEKTGAERREEEGRGLTPELRARLERERRARAAEERIRKMEQQ